MTQKEGEEEEQLQVRKRMLALADNFLRDAECTEVSRNTRLQACFDSIYLRLLVMARRAGHPEPEEHPSERVILAGATAAGLDTESTDEVVDLYEAVRDLGHKPGRQPVNLLHGLALARHIRERVKK